MRVAGRVVGAVVLYFLGAGAGHAQMPAAPAAVADESTRNIAGGGISVPGWMGKADGDANLKDARLASEGTVAARSTPPGAFTVDAMRVTTGPAVTYWNPKNMATGDYTVSARFTEPKFMNLNTHPHPYGIMIGGNDLGTAQQSLLYCGAYGSGTFIVRGFGPEPFQMNGRRGEANAAVHKAAGPGEPVTQEIAMAVKGDKVSCSINGAVVATYDKAALVAAGKLKSTDGIYGIRFAHNTDAVVTDLKLTTP